MAWTFEQAWAVVDQKINQWAQYVSETTDSLQKWASDLADKTGKSFLDKALKFSKSLASLWDWWKEKAQWAVDSGKQVVEWAKTAIASVSERVNSFQEAINNWLAVIKKEWGQYVAEVKDDAGNTTKMAMERTTAAGKEVLAQVDGQWQYVKDTAWDYADKTKAIATVAYNNTLKPTVDWVSQSVQAWVNTAKKVYAEWKRQYREELAAIKWDTAMAAKWEKHQDKPQENTPEKSKEHIVKSWDTLSKIALTEVGWDKSKAWEYLKKIIEANKGIDPNKIAVWQKIALPKIA